MTGTMVAGMLSSLSQALAGLLLSSLWQAGLLVLGAAAALAALPRLTAAVRYGAWVAVLAVAVLLPAVSIVLRGSGRVADGAAGAAVRVDVRWSFAIAGIWLALVAFRAVQLMLAALRLWMVARRAVPVGDAAVASLPAATGRAAELCVSEDVERPSVIGFFRPRILIPSSMFVRLDGVELEHIVLHEREHLRRGDDWVNLLQKMALVVFPFHPALLWVERRLCLERELACDDGVLRATQAPKAYASSLVRLAEHRLARGPVSLALGAWERRPELARRVQHILRLQGEAMSLRQAAAAMVVLAAGLLGGATEMSRAPQLVGFVTPAAASVSGASALSANAGTMPAPGGSVRLQTAEFRGTPGARAVLASAVMPARVGNSLARQRRVHRVRGAARARIAAPRWRTSQSWAVLTNWDEAGSARDPRTTPALWTVQQTSQTYAAVRTPDGWLVIQL